MHENKSETEVQIRHVKTVSRALALETYIRAKLKARFAADTFWHRIKQGPQVYVHSKPSASSTHSPPNRTNGAGTGI